MPARKRTRVKRGGEPGVFPTPQSMATPPMATTQLSNGSLFIDSTSGYFTKAKEQATGALNALQRAMSGGYKRKSRRSKRYMKGGDFTPNTSSYGSTAAPISGVPTVSAQMIGGKSRKRRSHRHTKACKHGKSRKCRKSRRH